MRRSNLVFVIFAGLVVVTALVLGLYFGLAQSRTAADPKDPKDPSDPKDDDPFDPKEMARRCAVLGVTPARCAEILEEYGMEGTAENFDKDVLECKKYPDQAQATSCILDNLKRASPFEYVFDGKNAAVYPENYPALTLSVDSVDLSLGQSDELALVERGSPLLMTFKVEGKRHSIRTADGRRAVYVATNGALSVGDTATVQPALFDLLGTGVPNTVRIAPVEKRAGKLFFRAVVATSIAPFVIMRLDRRTGLAVDVTQSTISLTSGEDAWHRAFIIESNDASCCNKLMGTCSAEQRQKFPLCCSDCKDSTTACEWKASIDAAVDDRECCFSWSTLPNEAVDYNSCLAGAGRAEPLPPTLQYARKCDPTPAHTFAVVPPGVWALAPSGVRLPAYGRVAQMRIAGSGFRGVRCA
jgi:hypothetical protein